MRLPGAALVAFNARNMSKGHQLSTCTLHPIFALMSTLIRHPSMWCRAWRVVVARWPVDLATPGWLTMHMYNWLRLTKMPFRSITISRDGHLPEELAHRSASSASMASCSSESRTLDGHAIHLGTAVSKVRARPS